MEDETTPDEEAAPESGAEVKIEVLDEHGIRALNVNDRFNELMETTAFSMVVTVRSSDAHELMSWFDTIERVFPLPVALICVRDGIKNVVGRTYVDASLRETRAERREKAKRLVDERMEKLGVKPPDPDDA